MAVLLALLAACGGDDEHPTATVAPAEPTATEAAATNGDVEAGRVLAAQQCVACHTVDGGQAVGPTWLGLYGSEVELEDGTTVIADEEYIHESIVEPNAKIHAGYPANVMPSYAATLSEEQIQNIIAYIRTLD